MAADVVPLATSGEKDTQMVPARSWDGMQERMRKSSPLLLVAIAVPMSEG